MSDTSHADLVRKLERVISLTGDLDADLAAHVDYYFECVRAHAHALSAAQAADANVKAVEAAQSELFRAHAANTGEKLSVDACASKVRQSELYQEAVHAHLGLQRDAQELLAFKLAFESRGHILHDLTLLATRGGNAQGIADYATLRQKSAEQRTGNKPARTPIQKR